jgi:hypothetical protein
MNPQMMMPGGGTGGSPAMPQQQGMGAITDQEMMLLQALMKQKQGGQGVPMPQQRPQMPMQMPIGAGGL